MKKILHQLICSLSHYLQGFVHSSWLFGISSINSMIHMRLQTFQGMWHVASWGMVGQYSRSNLLLHCDVVMLGELSHVELPNKATKLVIDPFFWAVEKKAAHFTLVCFSTSKGVFTQEHLSSAKKKCKKKWRLIALRIHGTNGIFTYMKTIEINQIKCR